MASISSTKSPQIIIPKASTSSSQHLHLVHSNLIPQVTHHHHQSYPSSNPPPQELCLPHPTSIPLKHQPKNHQLRLLLPSRDPILRPKSPHRNSRNSASQHPPLRPSHQRRQQRAAVRTGRRNESRSPSLGKSGFLRTFLDGGVVRWEERGEKIRRASWEGDGVSVVTGKSPVLEA